MYINQYASPICIINMYINRVSGPRARSYNISSIPGRYSFRSITKKIGDIIIQYTLYMCVYILQRISISIFCRLLLLPSTFPKTQSPLISILLTPCIVNNKYESGIPIRMILLINQAIFLLYHTPISGWMDGWWMMSILVVLLFIFDCFITMYIIL